MRQTFIELMSNEMLKMKFKVEKHNEQQKQVKRLQNIYFFPKRLS